MTPTTRISQLYADGEREDAVSLAREVLRNDKVEAVEFNEDNVVVRTRYFEGRHPITGENDDGIVVDPRGEWWVRDDQSVRFTTFSLYDNVFAALERAEQDKQPARG